MPCGRLLLLAGPLRPACAEGQQHAEQHKHLGPAQQIAEEHNDIAAQSQGMPRKPDVRLQAKRPPRRVEPQRKCALWMRGIAEHRRSRGENCLRMQEGPAGMPKIVVVPLVPARSHIDEERIVQPRRFTRGDVSELPRDGNNVRSGEERKHNRRNDPAGDRASPTGCLDGRPRKQARANPHGKQRDRRKEREGFGQVRTAERKPQQRVQGQAGPRKQPHQERPGKQQ